MQSRSTLTHLLMIFFSNCKRTIESVRDIGYRLYNHVHLVIVCAWLCGQTKESHEPAVRQVLASYALVRTRINYDEYFLY